MDVFIEPLLRNFEAQNIDVDVVPFIQSSRFALGNFDWERSNEGREYWERIANNFEKLQMNYIGKDLDDKK